MREEVREKKHLCCLLPPQPYIVIVDGGYTGYTLKVTRCYTVGSQLSHPTTTSPRIRVFRFDFGGRASSLQGQEVVSVLLLLYFHHYYYVLLRTTLLYERLQAIQDTVHASNTT